MARDEVHKVIGDTGMMDFMLKAIANRTVGPWAVFRSLSSLSTRKTCLHVILSTHIAMQLCLQDVQGTVPCLDLQQMWQASLQSITSQIVIRVLFVSWYGLRVYVLQVIKHCGKLHCSCDKTYLTQSACSRCWHSKAHVHQLCNSVLCRHARAAGRHSMCSFTLANYAVYVCMHCIGIPLKYNDAAGGLILTTKTGCSSTC